MRHKICNTSDFFENRIEKIDNLSHMHNRYKYRRCMIVYYFYAYIFLKNTSWDNKRDRNKVLKTISIDLNTVSIL